MNKPKPIHSTLIPELSSQITKTRVKGGSNTTNGSNSLIQSFNFITTTKKRDAWYKVTQQILIKNRYFQEKFVVSCMGPEFHYIDGETVGKPTKGHNTNWMLVGNPAKTNHFVLSYAWTHLQMLVVFTETNCFSFHSFLVVY